MDKIDFGSNNFQVRIKKKKVFFTGKYTKVRVHLATATYYLVVRVALIPLTHPRFCLVSM